MIKERKRTKSCNLECISKVREREKKLDPVSLSEPLRSRRVKEFNLATLGEPLSSRIDKKKT